MRKKRRGIRSFSQAMREPSPSPLSARLAWVVIAVGAVASLAVAVRNMGRHDALTRWREELEVAAGRPPWPEWSSAWPQLPPQMRSRQQLPQDLRGPYAYAAGSRKLLQHIACYCGCVREGHRSNLNCFVSSFQPDGTPVWTDHSFSCPMCVDIAREVQLMASPGMPLLKIRDEIDSHYRSVGEPTKTPLPGHEENRER